MSEPPLPTAAGEPAARDIAAHFAQWWGEWRVEASDPRVTRVQGAPSGFSNETWFIDIAWRERGEEMSDCVVLRIEPQGPAFFDDCNLELQCEVMLALAGSDTPVPAVLAQVRDPVVLGAPFYVMEFIPGRVASGRRPGFHGHGLFYEASLSGPRNHVAGSSGSHGRSPPI